MPRSNGFDFEDIYSIVDGHSAQNRSKRWLIAASAVVVIAFVSIVISFTGNSPETESASPQPTEEVVADSSEPQSPDVENDAVASPEATDATNQLGKFDLGELVPVISVTDGDTLRVRYEGESQPVRLIGINTPESINRTECFGPEASRFAKKALEGKRVYLVRDGMQADRDQYGRLLRFVFLEDKTNFNVTLVREGFAKYVRKYPVANPFRSELSSAQDFAWQENKGMWEAC